MKDDREKPRKRVCLVASVRYFVECFWLDQIAKLSEQYDVTVLVKTDDVHFLRRWDIDVRVISAPIERRITPLRDLQAFAFLVRTFRAGRFDLVHSTGPKAALLAPFAAWIARIPNRIHTFTGQVWGSHTGLMRWILKMADTIGAAFTTHILVDSFSQRDFLIAERVIPAEKSSVLAQGSVSGVNLEQFRPSPEFRAEIRAAAEVPVDELAFLYMARLTRDKGALVMAEGFAKFKSMSGSSAHLLVVGPDEEGVRPSMMALCRSCISDVHFFDYTTEPEKYMAAADVLCLPSYREGFGSVLINAAAVGIPAVASRIYGSEEAVQENSTGLLHEAGNPAELAAKMVQLADDPELRRRLGRNAYARVVRDFSEATVTQALLNFYERVLGQRRT